MAGLIPKCFWRVYGEQPGGTSKFFLFIACTGMNEYIKIIYFLKNDETIKNEKKIWLRC